MRRLVLAIFALFCGVSAAFASGYSDLNLAVSASLHADWAAVISHSTAALADTELPATYRPIAYLQRADAYAATGKLDLALADYAASIAADPDYPDALIQRARIYAAIGKTDLAIADYTALIAKRPAFVENYRLRGLLYQKQEKFDLAITDFSQIIAYEPSANAYDTRAVAYYYAAQDDKALDDLNKGVDMDDKDVGIYEDRAVIHLDMGDFPDSKRDYEQVVNLQPANLNAYLWIGSMDWLSSDFKGASLAFAQGMAAHPDYGQMCLWYFVSQISNGARDDVDFNKKVASIDLKKWPGPLIEVYLGRAQPDAVLKSETSAEARKAGHACEADLFIGEWYALAGDKSAAAPLLQATEAECGRASIGGAVASAQLKRIQ